MGSGKDKKAAKAEERPFAVGDVVVTSADPVLEGGNSTREPGVIVDDFGTGLASDAEDYGRSWGVAKRWAVKLDDGRLVFRATDEVSRPG